VRHAGLSGRSAGVQRAFSGRRPPEAAWSVWCSLNARVTHAGAEG
jgi:hypothetical protein